MKSTRKFLRSKRYLAEQFDCIWTICLGLDGKVIPNSKKKRFVKGGTALLRSIHRQLDRMRCPLRVKL